MNGKIVLQTKRFVVREMTMDDMDDLYKLYESPEITRFVEPLYSFEKEREYQEQYIRLVYGEYGFGLWLVTDKKTGALVGRIGVEPRQERPGVLAAMQDHYGNKALLPPEKIVEMGYIVAVDWQGQGVATEVCRAVLEHARERLQKYGVYARVHPDNAASVRLMEKLGFSPTEVYYKGEQVWVLLFDRL